MDRLFGGNRNDLNRANNYCRNPTDMRNMRGRDPGGPYCLMFSRNIPSMQITWYKPKYCAAFLHLCGKHISHSSLLFSLSLTSVSAN